MCLLVFCFIQAQLPSIEDGGGLQYKIHADMIDAVSAAVRRLAKSNGETLRCRPLGGEGVGTFRGTFRHSAEAEDHLST